MTNIVKYESRDGQTVELTFDTIKKFLVHGKPEFVSAQEMVFFMGICKARGLNPFAKDCYLIKYTERDSAAIITSIDYFRSRAKAQKDFRGYQAGIIVENDEGDIRYSSGLIKSKEKLLGGWFRARPAGWDHDFELEVNLSGYLKKTAQGELTRFWQAENQPTMIRKVAESQGLRECWPSEFAKLYVAEEVDAGAIMEDAIDTAFEIKDEKKKPIQYDIRDANGLKSVDAQVEYGEADKTDSEKVQSPAPGEKIGKPVRGISPDEDPFRLEWINLKAQGFVTFVYKNRARLEKLPQYHQEMKAKWEKIVPGHAWPLDPKPEMVTPPTQKEVVAPEVIEPPWEEIPPNGKEVMPLDKFLKEAEQYGEALDGGVDTLRSVTNGKAPGAVPPSERQGIVDKWQQMLDEQNSIS